MYITVTCLKCKKRFLVMVVAETELLLLADDFCGCCRKILMEEFEKQFYIKRLRTEKK